MSYKEYMEELAGVTVVNTDEGFFSYKIESLEHMFIHALWIKPESRGTDAYMRMVHAMEATAKEQGAKFLYGTLKITTPGMSRALCAHIKHGAKIIIADGDTITVQKEL